MRKRSLLVASALLVLLVISSFNGYSYVNGSIRAYSSTIDRAVDLSFPALMDVILLDSNLTPTIYAIPECIEVDEGPIYVNVENATSEGGGEDYELRVRIYQSCTNISGAYDIRVVNVSKIYYEEINWTTIVLDINLYSSVPVVVAEPMGISEMEIRYGVLNSTHYRVEVILKGVFSPTLGNTELFDEIRIEYIVSSQDWSSYVIGEDGPEFIGYLPIALTVLSPQGLMDIIEERVQSYIDYITENTWVLENIVNKALMEENQTKRNELIWQFVENETSKVFTLNYPYSAGNLKVILGYTGIEVRSDERIVNKSISETLKLLRLDRVKILQMGRNLDDYLLPAIRAYLDDGDPYPLLDKLIGLLKSKELPMGIGFIGEAPFISDIVLPFENEAGFAFLTLPLPRDVAEALKAKYLYIVMFRVNEGGTQEPSRESFVRIVYEREFVNSVRVDYLNETLICIQNAVSSFETGYNKFIYDSIVNGINITEFTRIKYAVSEALEPCRRLLASIEAGRENETRTTPLEEGFTQTTTFKQGTSSSSTNNQATVETPTETQRPPKATRINPFMILTITIIVMVGIILGFRIVKKQ